MKKLIILAPLVLGACSFPGFQSNGLSEYEYVGVHKICSQPTDGSKIFGPFGVDTDYVVFRQKSKDGTVAPVDVSCK